MRIQLNLNRAQENHLWELAVIEGFMREEPRKRWSENEKKEAIRFVLLKLSGADRFANKLL